MYACKVVELFSFYFLVSMEGVWETFRAKGGVKNVLVLRNAFRFSFPFFKHEGRCWETLKAQRKGLTNI